MFILHRAPKIGEGLNSSAKDIIHYQLPRTDYFLTLEYYHQIVTLLQTIVALLAQVRSVQISILK